MTVRSHAGAWEREGRNEFRFTRHRFQSRRNSTSATWPAVRAGRDQRAIPVDSLATSENCPLDSLTLRSQRHRATTPDGRPVADDGSVRCLHGMLIRQIRVEWRNDRQRRRPSGRDQGKVPCWPTNVPIQRGRRAMQRCALLRQMKRFSPLMDRNAARSPTLAMVDWEASDRSRFLRRRRGATGWGDRLAGGEFDASNDLGKTQNRSASRIPQSDSIPSIRAAERSSAN